MEALFVILLVVGFIALTFLAFGQRTFPTPEARKITRYWVQRPLWRIAILSVGGFILVAIAWQGRGFTEPEVNALLGWFFIGVSGFLLVRWLITGK